MESFFDNPPEDLEKDESTFNYNNLKDGIKRLQEKYGDNSLPALKEVEVLVEKFLEALGLDRKNGEKQKLYEKYKVSLILYYRIIYLFIFVTGELKLIL
jgi:hypothetical protein